MFSERVSEPRIQWWSLLKPRHSYLETLLPLLACFSSFVVLLFQCIQYRLHSPASAGYQRIGVSNGLESGERDEDVNESAGPSPQQALDSAASPLPIGKKAIIRRSWVLAEGLTLLVQAVVCVSRLIFSWNPNIPYEYYSFVAIWLYLLALALTRLLTLASPRRYPFSGIRAHVALLYTLLWLVEMTRIWTTLLYPDRLTSLSRRLIFVEALFSSILLSIALLSRDQTELAELTHQGEPEPSHDPGASLLSLAIFGWVDAIVWRGYTKTLQLSDVWDLAAGDKAAHVLAKFLQVKKTHSLAVRLIVYSKRRLLTQGAWAVFSNTFAFLPTLLVKGILQHLEDPENVPASLAWLYVILLLGSGAMKTLGDNQALWIGRRVGIQFQAIIIGELYKKALRRPAAASFEKEDEKNTADTDINKSKKQTKKKHFSFGREKKPTQKAGYPARATTQADSQANNGTIINLMSIDAFKVSEVTAYLHFLWASVPVELVLAILLLYSILGKSALAGICIMLFIMPLNFFIARSFQRAQKKIMASTDNRIHITNEVLQNIRIIKYFAWEARFSNQVSNKRRIELRALRGKYILWASAATLWSAVPIVTAFASFFVYTVVEKKRLLPSVAFPALSTFALLRIPLDQLADMVAHVQEAKVSIDRVDDFLKEDETEKYVQIRETKSRASSSPKIALERATLAWNESGSPHDTSSPGHAFRLIDIHVNFELGRLNVITGPTGCGKTSLLMALLGEMKLLQGHVHVPGGDIRQNLRPDPTTGLTDSVAFCAQQAWLVNDTIRENILFASPINNLRYKRVVSACALERDLEVLDAGDQTLVGEKGITLSGGQKQRVSLARALYSTARHILLDDCLSAVDSHTARHIFDNAIQGDLMNDRTCILVTHNISLAVPNASYVVVLDNGKVRAQGPPHSIMLSGALGEDVLKSRPGSTSASATLSRVNSDLQTANSGFANGEAVSDELVTEVDKKTSSRSESKVEGRIRAATIKMYLSAMGPWYFWVITLTTFIATQAGSVATNVWIEQWAKAYRAPEHVTASASNNTGFPGDQLSNPNMWQSSELAIQWSPSPRSIAGSIPEVRVGYYLGIYALLAMAYVATCFCREMIVFFGSLHASWQLHEQLLDAVTHARFQFFDSTPLGQLMNRFSKDIESIDQEVSPVATGLVDYLASIVTVVILISVITPGFLVAAFPIACIYFTVAMFYIRSSRDLKRIESVQRSPLYQAFGETLAGIVTIRAYGDQLRFITENQNLVDTHNRPFIYLSAINRWLAVRADLAGALVAFSAGASVMCRSGEIGAGAAGLSLSYAITFTDTVLWLVRLYGTNEQNMNSVERVKEYLGVEQEARAHIPETQPAANWPSRGCVEFIGYSTRYRADLGRVLKNVTFKVTAGEKVGIVGRTGAGKSSLALALLRGLEAESGKILIDDVDIGLIGLQDLRQAVTIVPQDPTLFTGSLRSNLDPFELYTDEDILTALQRVQLISSPGRESGSSTSASPTVSSGTPTLNANSAALPGMTASEISDSTLIRFAGKVGGNKNIFYDLSTSVSESGGNFSQGQRQLVCLARALLKSPKVLVMDEATASIDYATDVQIQDTLRELKHNTVITIAHRLQTIIDYDKVIVLEAGEVAEFDDPWELMQKEGGCFQAMCETSGDFANLSQLARKSWEDRRLVDDR